MAEREENGTQPARGEGQDGGHAQSRRGLVIAIAILIVVACIVLAGVIPRLKARAALRAETYDLAVPTVSVIHPKLGAPET